MKYCLSLLLSLSVLSTALYGADPIEKQELKKQFEFYCQRPSDICEHVPVLKDLASQCSSVIEIGIRSMVSTWGVLQGLSESKATCKSYIGIDLAPPPVDSLSLARVLAKLNKIDFCFWEENDMNIEIPVAEMLFIDSLHTYCHLTYELEKFSSSITKFIAMHDTSEPWGTRDDTEYRGQYTEYPSSYDRTKRGLWAAVEDFLKRHPEWALKERRLNNHGLTVLQRVCH